MFVQLSHYICQFCFSSLSRRSPTVEDLRFIVWVTRQVADTVEGHSSHNKCKSTHMLSCASTHECHIWQCHICTHMYTYVMVCFNIWMSYGNVYCAKNEGLKEFGANNAENSVSLSHTCLLLTLLPRYACMVAHMTVLIWLGNAGQMAICLPNVILQRATYKYKCQLFERCSTK